MTRLRHAAAILLTRGHGADREVYLVERAPGLQFFGGYWAFPGGVLADVDHDPEREAALRRCAVRELFEETGVLLEPLRSQLDRERRDALRRALLAADADHAPWHAQRALVTGALAHATRVMSITTPPFAPVRYATLFVQVELPQGEQPGVVAGELVQGRFVRPADAVAAWLRGEIAIVPPVVFLLELMMQGDTTLLERASAAELDLERGGLHPVRFTPGIFVAPLRTPTLPPATTTNTLLVGNDTIHVVEPATPDASEQQRLFRKLDDLQARGKQLAAILLTHHHPDHVGAVNAVSQRYQLPVHAHALTLARIPPGFIAGRALDEGDRIELGCAPDGEPGWHLRVLFTPGHARGHLAFLDSRYRAAIVGDLLSVVSTILIDPPEGHLRTYLGTLARLLREDIATVYPAHGPAHRCGHDLVRQFLAHRQQREELLLRALRGGPRSLEELVPEVYADTDPALHGLAQRSLLAGLEKLVEDRTLVQDGARWRRAQ